MDDSEERRPESLLPYDSWAEEALRQVAVRAIDHAARRGMPGDHHFYITFRVDHPAAVVPARLRAQYPQEMTIVLQHQYWDLKVDEAAGNFSVGLSFGGVPTTLVVPFAALSGFADPHVRFGLRFVPEMPSEAEAPVPAEISETGPAAVVALPRAAPPAEETGEAPQVVQLDAFRRRTTPKDQPP